MIYIAGGLFALLIVIAFVAPGYGIGPFGR